MRNKTYAKVLDDMLALHDAKNTDYAEADDPYSNFTFAAQFAGVTVQQVFDVMIGIKQARLLVLRSKDGPPRFESIEDSVRDRGVYATLPIAYERDRATAGVIEEVEEMVNGLLVVPDEGDTYTDEWNDNVIITLVDEPADGEIPPRSDCLCPRCPGCYDCRHHGCITNDRNE